MASTPHPLVLLAYPKIDHEKDYVHFWAPFSLLVLAQPLIAQGLEVMLFDGNRQGLNEWQSLLDKHIHRATCIGLSIMTGGGQIAHALRLVEEAKARAKCPPVVLGGPHVNVLGHQTALHPLVDAVLTGPGQNSLPAFIEASRGNLPLEQVPGLIMRCNGQLLTGAPNPPKTRPIGQYPWDLVHVEDYIRNDPCVAPRTLNYVSSQGCAYSCRFCYETTYQRRYSSIPADVLIEDICSLVSRYNLSGVKFYDADWFIDIDRAIRFAEMLLQRRVHINWAAAINPNDILRSQKKGYRLLELIAQSGCRRLLMGIESGSDRVLQEVINKQITRAAMLRVARDISDAGIIGAYTFIVGFPGESDREIDETYDFIRELQTLAVPPETRVHLFAPYPGTELYDTSIAQGWTPPKTLEDWSNFDYYDSQTPWTNPSMVQRARAHTFLRVVPRKGEVNEN